MSFSVTASLLTGSRNLIESVTNERNDNEITVIQFFLIYSLLTKMIMNSKLTNIETKNSSLEFRLTEIEKKITAIGHR